MKKDIFLKKTLDLYAGLCQNSSCDCAGMVELVDAADSKSAEGNLLRVQVSLPVPKEFWLVRDN